MLFLVGKIIRNIFRKVQGFSVPYSQPVSAYVPPSMSATKFHPHKTSGEIIILYNLIFKFLDSKLKGKVRRAYNRRELGEHYQQKLKRLSHKLLAAKRNAQETFFRSLLQIEGKSLAEFYRYVN